MSTLTKSLVFLFGLGAGYALEPNLFPRGNGGSDSPQSLASQDAEEPTNQIDLDLSEVLPSDLPKEVSLTRALIIKNPANDNKITLNKGTKVEVIKINGDQLIILPKGTELKSAIDPDFTNFKELVLPNMLDRISMGITADTKPSLEKAPLPEVTPTDKILTTPVPVDNPAETEITAPVAPEPVVKALVEPKQEQEQEPVVVTPPQVEPSTSAPPAGQDLFTDDEIIAMMKKEVEAGNVREFKTSQVTEWKVGPEEIFNGNTYQQSGRVIFKAQTLLGEQIHGAIALIKDGKIDRWLWARNMLEMR